MIEIREIGPERKADINIPNRPFLLFGRMIPSYINETWSYTVEKSEKLEETCFPDEIYDYDTPKRRSFLGAYDGGTCVGLAVVEDHFFKYMYVLDLKVDPEYRRRGVAKRLMDAAGELARSKGYRGVYLQAQDNNLGACLFYLKAGFRIGGLDTEVYKGTKQEGKADILFYRDF